jgi:hypothetical protein
LTLMTTETAIDCLCSARVMQPSLAEQNRRP